MNSLRKLPTFHDHRWFLNKIKSEKCTQKFHTLDDKEPIEILAVSWNFSKFWLFSQAISWWMVVIRFKHRTFESGMPNNFYNKHKQFDCSTEWSDHITFPSNKSSIFLRMLRSLLFSSLGSVQAGSSASACLKSQTANLYSSWNLYAYKSITKGIYACSSLQNGPLHLITFIFSTLQTVKMQRIKLLLKQFSR